MQIGTLPLSWWGRQGWVGKGIPHSLAGTSYVKLWHFRTPLLKLAGAHRQGFFLMSCWSQGACPTMHSRCLSRASKLKQPNRQTMPPDHLALVGKGICILGPPWNYNNWKDSSWTGCHIQGTVQVVDWNTPPVLLKRTIYLSWRFSLRDRLQVCTHLKSTEAFVGEM